MAIKIAGTTVIDDNRNITTNVGTIDGRDIAVDGAKLDGISAGATDNTVANAALPKAGGTMTGDLITTSGNNNGIYIGSGGTNITSVSPSNKDVVIQDVAEIRFGGSSWDYNAWAGIAFNDSTEVLTIGGPSSGVFTSNASPPDITINFDGLSGTNGLTYEGSTIWHAGNDGSSSGLDADLLDGQHGSYYTGYTDTAISNLVNSSPATLDTLNELAAALDDDPNFATTVSTNIGTKVSKSGDTMTGPLTIDTNNTGMLKLSATNGSPWAIDLQRDDATNSRVFNGGGYWQFEHRPRFVGNTAFDDGYHPNADKWTTARTLTLTGDVTGSVSWDGSGNASIATNWQGGQANTTLNMNNFAIINANNLTFNDPGPNEGVTWNGGNNWKIYESPDDLTTNSGGNLQFVQGSTREMTLNTSGSLYTAAQGTLWGSSNDGSGSGLDADTVDGWHRDEMVPYQSGNDFVNGTLVTTDIPSSAASGDSFVIEITGKAYGSSRPHSVIAEGYIYNNTIINTNGVNMAGSNFNYLKVMNNSGNLSFWWPRHGYWNSYSVIVRSSSASQNSQNRVTSIVDSVDPSGATKKIQIDLATVWTSANDGSGSGLDADLLDGNHASAFATSAQGTLATNALPKAGGTMTGELQLNARLDVGSGTQADAEIRIYKADNNVSDHIQFYNGTTRMGEIGCEDTSWLRINQETAKNIYTPRYMRADGGFFVDGTTKGINGSGNFIGGTITGASDANVSNWNAAYTTANAALPKAGGTMTGGLIPDTPGDYDQTAITSLTNAPINYPEVNVGSSDTYLPAFHMRAIHSGGYRTHMNVGLHKDNSGWGNNSTGFYVALGGNDNNPTEAYKLTYGGQLNHTSAGRFFADNYHPNADKLTTARNINGVAFDGTANITVADATKLPLSGGTMTGDIVSNVRNKGVFGTYDSTKTDHIWSMGTAYRNHASGTNFGNLYGLAYKHTNNTTGGAMASGHQMVWCQNGTPNSAMGTNIWTSGSIIVGGTVDGRDVAADGTKLDGIATGANNYSLPATPSVTGINIGSQVNLAESTDRADLLQITSSTSGWAGLQIRNSSNEGRWSFMTDGATAGFYDDENNEWAVQMQENGGVTLYHNNVANFTTGATYMEMARHLDMNNYDIYGVDQIFHHGDTNTYMQFHAADQWRVVTGGAERLEVNNSQITSTEPIHAPSFHGSGSSLTGVVLNSGGTMTGPLVIDTDNNSGGGLRLLVNQTSPNQDFYFAEEIVTNLTGSTATTGDREQGGIYIDLNSTATGGDTSNEHRVYGAYIDTYSTGDADIVAGVYAPTYAAPSVGTTGQVMGGYFLASDYGGAGGVTWVRGIHAKAQADNSGSSPSIMEGGAFEVKVYSDADSVGQLYGVKSNIRFDSGGGTKQSTSNPSYVYYAKYDNLTGVSQGNNSYLYYGADYGVRSPNAYGVYIAGDLDNYFGGKVTADSFVGDGSALTNIPGPSTTAGAVGTYALMQRRSGTGTLNEGSTIAGSSIAFANINWSSSHSRYGSGTWRVMGIFVGSGTGSTNYITVCVRIS